jgi:hypothetical protein
MLWCFEPSSFVENLTYEHLQLAVGNPEKKDQANEPFMTRDGQQAKKSGSIFDAVRNTILIISPWNRLLPLVFNYSWL